MEFLLPGTFCVCINGANLKTMFRIKLLVNGLNPGVIS